MKAACVMAAVMLAGLAQSGSTVGLPSGTYAGTASWRGPADSVGSYKVERTFSGNTLTAHFAWTDTQAREERHSVTFAPKANEPGFDVLDEQGGVVGRGHCYDDACAYRATFGPVSVEESWRWSRNELTVLGAKSGPGFSVVWKESLQSR